jgi:mevalonate kinase
VGAVGSARAKLILFGEHAAVFGHPAIGISLRECTRVTIDGAPSPRWNLDAVVPEDRETVAALLGRLELLVPDLAPRGRAGVRIESDVPRGAGFGSSAALCGAFARAALAYVEAAGPETAVPDAAGSGAARSDPWSLAHDLERLFHGTPSGIDTGLALLPGVLAFSPQPPALPGCVALPGVSLWLIVGALPRDGASLALVQGVGQRMNAGDQAARDAIEALGKIAAGARNLLQRAGSGPVVQAEGIGSLADRAMDSLRSLGLSSPGLDAILGFGKRAGSLGGKLSGAGAGGAFFMVMQDGAAAAAALPRLEADARNAGLRLQAALRVVHAGSGAD